MLIPGSGPASLDVSRLEALVESAHLLHRSLELDDLLAHLLGTVMDRLLAPRGIVALREGEAWRVSLARGVAGLEAGEPCDEERLRECGCELLMPIGDPPGGLIALGAAEARLSTEEQTFVRALLALASIGLANARAHSQARRLNERLDRKVHELRTLLELGRAVAGTTDPDEIVRLLALTLAGQLAVGRYAIVAGRRGQPTVIRRKGVALDAWPEFTTDLAAAGDAVDVGDLPAGPFRDALESQRVALVFPMRSGSGPFGFVALGSRAAGAPFGRAERELGAGLVGQAVVALENAWHQRDVLEKKQLERELALAASIQQGLFPSELPVVPGLDLAATSRPARQVGGDYYDAVAIDPGDRAGASVFCVADVSGKGIAAAILMSNMQAMLRALLGREASLGELARCMNELLYSSTPGNKYITAVLLAIDRAGSCRYVNGGHTEGLLLRRSGEVRWLPPTGLALGLFPGVTYEEGDFTLEPGDVVALYSDGVTEAMNPSGEEYGSARLVECFRQRSSLGASAIVESVLEDLDVFTAGAPPHDDVTLLVLKRQLA